MVKESKWIDSGLMKKNPNTKEKIFIYVLLAPFYRNFI